MKRVIAVWCLLIAFSFVGIVGANAADDKVIKWKMQCSNPKGDAAYDIHAVEFAKMVERVSNGKIKVDLFAPGQLVAVPEMVTALSNGMIDAATVYGPLYNGIVPIADVESGLPYSFSSVDQVVELFWDPKYRLVDIIREGWAKKNIHYASPGSCGTYAFMTTYAVNSLQDIKGHKFRGMGSIGKWIRLAGGAPTAIPASEIYMSLKMGTVDGTPFTPMGLETMKLKEVVKYMVLPGVIVSGNVCSLVNKKSWDALPEDLRKKLLDEKEAISSYRRDGAAYAARDEIGLTAATKVGLKTVTWSDSDMMQARRIASEIWDEVGSKGASERKAIDLLKRYYTEKKLM